ncbi:hypothetical protein GQ44DRAFT_630359, partial [Phaeosphaeriaceae sp. PMI808]
ADTHDFGACQVSTNGALDRDATVKVASGCNAGWGLSDEAVGWRVSGSKGHGPRFQGIYLQNPVKKQGGIDGDTLFKLCRAAGAGDSSAFNCGSFQQNGDGLFQCNS